MDLGGFNGKFAGLDLENVFINEGICGMIDLARSFLCFAPPAVTLFGAKLIIVDIKHYRNKSCYQSMRP